LTVTVELADERFTSKVAEDVLIEAGMTRERRRQIRDKMAATVMLQSYLDSLR
jgi:putative Holliday junction resolvase